MPTFIRRYGFDPGNEVLLEIESVNILDLDPPASISGVGTGTVVCVGEFENGPFAASAGARGMDPAVYEVAGSSDLLNTAGALGYQYAGVTANNPCARSRKADGALTAEYWNGNAFVQLNGKKFRRLLLARVDTSVGSVEFRRQAFLTGVASFTYNLEPAQVLQINNNGTSASATFNATAGTVTSGAGTYNTTFTGGETLTLGYDAATNFTVTFLVGDQTKAQVISRINAYAGFTFATDAGTTLLTLTGIQRGTGAQVRVVSASAGVLTKLGLTVATTPGTGNVTNIDAVTFQEIKTIVEAAITGVKLSQDNSGRPRIGKTFVGSDDWMTVGASTTATALGFTIGQHVSNSGYAYLRSGAGTFPTSFVGGETLTLGADDGANFTVVFQAGDTTQALIIDRINGTAGYTMARSISGTVTELRGNVNGGSVRVIGASAGAVLTALGFTANTTVSGTSLTSGKIPAGTLVTNASGSLRFVTMQDALVTVAAIDGITASGTGPYSVKVRHALDDGTGLGATAGALTTLQNQIDLSSFDVVNPQAVSVAMTEGQIDAAYATAIDATKDINSPAREANVIWSARQSNAIRTKLRSNVNEASSAGCFGRMACVRPPLGTTRTAALSGSAAPGVGATRDQRVVYNYPGVNTFVPAIAARGTGGGAGFTASGNVDIGSDGFMASVLSQLPPEENPGQLTTFTNAVNGLETSPNVQGFQMEDYVQFRAKGIAAPRMDDGVCIFQSGVTSVDPSVYPQLRNIARRRMADFIQDTLARRMKGYGKKLSTFVRRKAIETEIRKFLEGLLSRNQPAFQRIAGFTVDVKSGNTPDTLAQGIFRIIVRVRTLASLDAIVLATTIGESVTVDEVLPEAA
jgi:hypothetical protein